MNNFNETMDILESKFINMSLTKKMYLYFDHYKNEDISNYEKKSITITNSDFKNLKLINNEDKFKDFFKKYNICLILNINEKSRCIIINYLRDYKKINNYNTIIQCSHFLNLQKIEFIIEETVKENILNINALNVIKNIINI